MSLQSYEVTFPQFWARQSVLSVHTQNFIQKQASGELPVNPFFWEKQVGYNPISNTTGGERQFDSFQNGLNVALKGGKLQGPGGSKDFPYLEDLHKSAAFRLRAKVSSAQLEGGLILAELDKSFDFVRGAMVQTARAVKAARRGNVKGVWNALTGGKPLIDAAGDAKLAYSYAVKPVLNDVATTVRLLEEGLFVSPFIWQRSKRTLEARAESRVVYPSGAHSSVLVQGKIRYGGGIQYRVDQPVLATLDALGLTDPLTLAWELIPFSFVIDWFIPVGEFLHQITPPRGISFVKGYTLVKCDGTGTWSQDAATQPDPPGWRTFCRTEELLRDRRPLTEFPTPGLIVPDLSLNKDKIINGLALLRQALR